jgi:hypothetical protein
MNLSQKCRDRIFSSDPVPLGLDQIKPLLVVDLPIDTPPRAKDLHRNLLETPASQS